ncbi:MAG: PIN domain-containing protein [Persicimonas sp.]
MTFRVVLDANVVFPFSLRDTLLRAAAAGYFQVYWSGDILDETTRNLIKTGTISEQQAVHLVEAMTAAFPEAMVEDYEPLIDVMPNDEKDRHVAAAAVTAGAQVIVTNNLKDFRVLPEGVEAQSPDEFLVDLFDLDSQGVVTLLRKQARALKKPPKTCEELMDGLAKTVPSFVKAVREYLSEPD